MAKQKGQHLSDKNQYSAYKTQGRWAKNKREKLERHLKKYPNDERAKEALKNIPAQPTRKPPTTKVWTQPKIELAQAFASVGINGIHALGNIRLSSKVDDKEHLRFFEEERPSKKAKPKKDK